MDTGNSLSTGALAVVAAAGGVGAIVAVCIQLIYSHFSESRLDRRDKSKWLMDRRYEAYTEFMRVGSDVMRELAEGPTKNRLTLVVALGHSASHVTLVTEDDAIEIAVLRLTERVNEYIRSKTGVTDYSHDLGLAMREMRRELTGRTVPS